MIGPRQQGYDIGPALVVLAFNKKIDYVHDMGVTLQFWENGDQKGRSVLIHLPLVKAPCNVMPINLWCDKEVCCASARSERGLAISGVDPKSQVVPRIMSRPIGALQIPEIELQKPRPIGFIDELGIDTSLPFSHIT